ncbi:hypothetical protein AGMMS49938_17470 [Fibrobacterales bacterium]|nr:hypothetical protein AGMMS49938_17470 [Fibrobacterales bacterium]
MSNITNSAVQGMANPSPAAQIAGAFSPAPGTEGVAAQAIQGGYNAGKEFSKEFMSGTIRQHGRSPSAVLQDFKTQQAMAKPSGTAQIGKSTNKGIQSFQSKASGQFASASASPSNGSSKGSSQSR